ncbi:MAG: phycobiliprotein lyase [Leptolyngbyaceae cyanobacterium MO_188.B28]|nr:phycobiliprotein lyase [Leptolyngbyaceae cyanobacterium MO_188.B28]
MIALMNDQSVYFHRLMQNAEGKWQGHRTYESLKSKKKTRVSNRFEVRLNDTKQHILEELHQLPQGALPYTIEVSWISHDADTGKLLSEGDTLMGYHDRYLYRDSGYVTNRPIVSKIEMPSPDHMLIRTFYDGVTTLGDKTAAYEENFRWAGDHRLRTVLAWDKHHQLALMGQYIEHKLAA